MVKYKIILVCWICDYMLNTITFFGRVCWILLPLPPKSQLRARHANQNLNSLHSYFMFFFTVTNSSIHATPTIRFSFLIINSVSFPPPSDGAGKITASCLKVSNLSSIPVFSQQILLLINKHTYTSSDIFSLYHAKVNHFTVFFFY